jgi:hypothetical protein
MPIVTAYWHPSTASVPASASASPSTISSRPFAPTSSAAWADGLGADLIYDAVGGPGLEELAWATKRLGRIIVYGALGNGTEETRIPLGVCNIRGVKVYVGVTIFDFTGNPGLGIPPDRVAVKRAKAFIAEGPAANREHIELACFHEPPRPVGPIPGNIQISPSYESS